MQKLLFLIFILSSTPLAAQVLQTSRYENQDKAKDEEFSIFSLKEDGLALIRGTNKYKDGNRSWEVILLDTALHELASTTLDVDNHYTIIGYEYTPGELHLLFDRSGITGEMQIITYYLKTNGTARYSITPELNLNLTHFHKVEDNFVFGGFVNSEPCLLLYRTTQQNIKLIPGFFQKNTELLDLRVNTNQTFNAIILERGEGDEKKIQFRTYDSFGRLLLDDFATLENTLTIQTAISSNLGREELLIFGTWGKRNAQPASGFFSLSINPFTSDPIKRIYFGELEHFLDFLRPKRAASIKLKTRRAIENNKIPDYSKNIMPYKIIEHTTGFLLLAEGYNLSSSNRQQPTYGYNPYDNYPYSNYGIYSPYYRRYSPAAYGNNVVNPDDVTKSHSTLVNFSSSGDVLWDISLKFSNLKTGSLVQLSEAAITQDSVFLLYKKDSELKIKSFNLNTKESNESIQKIKLNSQLDNVRGERKEVGEISRWFGNTYYVWGYQTIRNRNNTVKNRTVLYINKLVFN
jgi:hypothetical protein